MFNPGNHKYNPNNYDGNRLVAIIFQDWFDGPVYQIDIFQVSESDLENDENLYKIEKFIMDSYKKLPSLNSDFCIFDAKINPSDPLDSKDLEKILQEQLQSFAEKYDCENALSYEGWKEEVSRLEVIKRYM